ncbi:multidrug transporter [Amycolatopsis orientalis]|uniref:Multidrug transporter n=1 Tax=Amycolatopsis orientalis TaxID=31958 RepID=A0A193BVC6_AMYOR|nr:multidrug efflux SMR transporter [Amycolatopsis orientalis]ANN16123.1 multidrug transporter [Amycolatopsis orientalis]
MSRHSAPDHDQRRAGLRAWSALLLAAVFEIVFTLSTGQSKGFTLLLPSLITIASAACATIFLSVALKSLDVGIGYVVWTGIGSVGTVVFGAVFFGETLTFFKCVCFAAIIGGVIGLKLTSGESPAPDAMSDRLTLR